jgi:hypothetical protein
MTIECSCRHHHPDGSEAICYSSGKRENTFEFHQRGSKWSGNARANPRPTAAPSQKRIAAQCVIRIVRNRTLHGCWWRGEKKSVGQKCFDRRITCSHPALVVVSRCPGFACDSIRLLKGAIFSLFLSHCH